MELDSNYKRAQMLRMDDQDRMSQASSTATISYFPVTKEGEGRVQAFGKRCQSAKRDPNCPVVIRGWLNKKDSRGLKLWKRRWFVLSNYCLFYYKDSREESVLGSIPLPSYKILFCTSQECKNQKFTFKVTHQGMRSYFFSADTQEDLLGWVRALSQSAAMEQASSINRRCSSYQDFTRIDYGESIDFTKKTSDGIGHSQKHKHVSRTLTNLSQLTVGQTGASQWARERLHHRHRSHSDGTSTPPVVHRRTCGCNPEEDCLYDHNSPPGQREMIGAGFLSTRSQPESRAHTPMGRVDIRPNNDLEVLPQSLYYTFSSPKPEFKSAPTTPLSERWQNVTKTPPTYASVHCQSNGRKPLAKTSKHDLGEMPTIRPYESDADTVLTRLCGCDKMLQALSAKLAQLQMDKESAQCALEVSRLQLHEWQERGLHAQDESLTHKSLLQEELVTIRARMCDVLLEMDWVWSQYERMESELCVIRSHLQHISNFGPGQEQTQAQKMLWIMEDILAALKVNRDHFYFLLVLQRPHVLQSTATHSGFTGQHTEMPGTGLTMDMEPTPPVRPALPQELQDNHQNWDYSHVLTESPYEVREIMTFSCR
uniref:PH domain-containing protein n=1 Tax=Cynoglossus semilaevis TaxID=244447 RepID=A0A3P8WRR6_CYNSE